MHYARCVPRDLPAWTNEESSEPMKNKHASLNLRTTSTIAHFAMMLAATAIPLFTATPSAHAGGILFYEIATPDVGLASAGYAARADDASTLFKNPAGMNRLDGFQFQAGAQALYGSLYFSPDTATSPRLGSGNGGNAVGWVPIASLFVTLPLAPKWRVGLGTLTYFGTAVDYGKEWVGRYFVQKSTLIGVTLMPAASFQATDWLSIGAGLNAMYGFTDAHVAVNNFVGPDGQMKINDTTWGFGLSPGSCFRLLKKLGWASAISLP
jgi:long-chain fatty acid transport protein